MESKKLIIVDCDGVVSDIYGPAVPLIRERFKNDEIYSQFNWDMVHNWEMTSVRKDVAEYFLDLVSDPEYMGGLFPYKGAIDAMQFLQGIARQFNLQVFMNTAVFNAAVGEAREAWIKDLQKHLEDELPYHIQGSSRVKTGKDKPVFDAVALIEDNLHVIKAHNVRLSYIVDHHHNRESTNPDFADIFSRSTRVTDLLTAAKILEIKLTQLNM